MIKILYITNYNSILNASGGFINDYLNDVLFYGLTELDNVEVTDSTPIVHLYKTNESLINKSVLWGRGFTTTFLIESDNVDRNNIEDKIKEKYFDIIIYGCVKRCLDYYDIVSKVYSANKIILIDGDDFTDVHPMSSIHPYFKRELVSDSFLPIHFAIPESKICKTKNEKIKEYGNIIPGQSGYIFENEQDYYNDYNSSYYGVTMKKAGWDCMRHYEILANNCIPYFMDLENCPKNTLTNLPKELLIEARHLATNFDNSNYFRILDELYNFTKQNLTTKKLAEYVLGKII
jgi:hypothetical protein